VRSIALWAMGRFCAPQFSSMIQLSHYEEPLVEPFRSEVKLGSIRKRDARHEAGACRGMIDPCLALNFISYSIYLTGPDRTRQPLAKLRTSRTVWISSHVMQFFPALLHPLVRASRLRQAVHLEKAIATLYVVIVPSCKVSLHLIVFLKFRCCYATAMYDIRAIELRAWKD
jgi:hypothetical protein